MDLPSEMSEQSVYTFIQRTNGLGVMISKGAIKYLHAAAAE